MKMLHNTKFLFLLSTLFVFSACGGTQVSTKRDNIEENQAIPKITEPEPKVAGPGETVKKYDLNKDGRADLWKVSVGKELVRVEVDLNKDGKIDLRRYYKEGKKVKEVFDLDYDGKFDVINYYHKGNLFKQAFFMKSKTTPDLFKYFELKDKKSKKIALVRKERDTNLDGKIDYWEYWESGVLTRILQDTDFDGRVDTQEKGE